MGCKEEKKDIYGIVSFYDVALSNNVVWFIDQYHNVLEKMDLGTGEINIEAFLPIFPEMENIINQYGNIWKFDNLIVISPRNSNHILLYSLVEKTFNDIKVDSAYFGDAGTYNLINTCFAWKNYLYLIPGLYKRIIRVDVKKAKIDYIDFGYDEIKHMISDPSRVTFSRNAVYENVAYLTFWQGPYILKFDFLSAKSELICVSDDKSGLSGITCDGKYIWVALRDKPEILKLDMNLKLILRISICIDSLELEPGINHLADSSKFLYAMPRFGNGIIKIDKNSLEIEKIFEMPTKRKEYLINFPLLSDSAMCMKKIDDRRVLAYSTLDAKVLLLNVETAEVSCLDGYLQDENLRYKVKSYYRRWAARNAGICGELEDYTLSDFVKMIVDDEFHKDVM
ncbi:MAG: hypothetical protein K6A29_05645 [Lachnospiraceae bacterium]|nr:hypothetical protein [Lachnospiraceae bacterium]